jgi:spermidine synthase
MTELRGNVTIRPKSPGQPSDSCKEAWNVAPVAEAPPFRRTSEPPSALRRARPLMNPRIVAFSIAVGLVVIVRIVAVVAKRRGQPFLGRADGQAGSWHLHQLLVASFLTLFAELAFIRWIAVEVRVFAYFKNLALLLCFVGFGLGCALANRAPRWPVAIKALLGLLLVIRIPYQNGMVLERLSESLGSAGDVEIWVTGNVWSGARFLNAALLAGILFLFLVWIFVPLGQIISRQMDLAANPLAAYSWNLFGSLAGILAFLGVSRLMWPPWVWLGTVLVGFAVLQNKARDRALVVSLLAPLVLLLYTPSDADHFAIWTPYQQIEYRRHYESNGDLRYGSLRVNHTGYQAIVNLSPEFLARHPTLLKEAADENTYNLPFRFATPSPRVLIVGSGMGNDVAAALRHSSAAVDAVEIDPAILRLGKLEHRERPYESPRVSVHLTDARAFLRRSRESYDLILFGLLDSHTQFSDYSNMRIDNFVYTKESFQEAERRLTPTGILFIKFQVNHPWMARRLAGMVEEVFSKPPLIFKAESSYTAPATCFVVSPSGRVEEALAADPRLAGFVGQNPAPLPEGAVTATTDDWPYLYQEGRWIPRTYFSVGLLVALVTFGLYWQIPEARRRPPSLFFFAMGAGFLLLETQVISRLALYFGTTWEVNGIVIAALLIALLAANWAVTYRSALPPAWILVALLAGLALVYWIPLERLPSSPSAAGILLASAFSIPVFFAGLLFALEFRHVSSPSAALAANVLGAVAGGLLENLSLRTGLRALLPVTMGLYALAGLGLWWRRAAAAKFEGVATAP